MDYKGKGKMIDIESINEVGETSHRKDIIEDKDDNYIVENEEKGKEKEEEEEEKEEKKDEKLKGKIEKMLNTGKISWGDVGFYSEEDDSDLQEDEEDEAESDNSDEEDSDEFDDLRKLSAGEDVTELQEGELDKYLKKDLDNCDCFHVKRHEFLSKKERDRAKLDCLTNLSRFENFKVGFNDFKCMYNCMLEVFDFIFQERGNEKKQYSKYRVAFADLFYRIRHEILFKALCKAFNLDDEKSDMPFSDLGIDSKRTPDKIHIVDGKIFVIEVTATSSLERAAVSKGFEQMGFESKYKKEIDLLIDRGDNVVYLPMFFNMSDLYNPINDEQMTSFEDFFKVNRPYYSLLKQISRSFSSLSVTFKQKLILPSSILFTDPINVTPSHEEHSFLYSSEGDQKTKIKYSETTVSNSVFKKITDNWGRLEDIVLRKSWNDEQRFRFVLDSGGYRINVEKDKKGLNLHDLCIILEKTDKISVFRHTYIQSGKNTISCMGSETGMKFIDRVEIEEKKEVDTIIGLYPGHKSKVIKNKRHMDLTKYSSKCKSYKTLTINCNYYDPKYEDIILNCIKKFDQDYDIAGEIRAGKMDVKNIDFGRPLLGQMTADKNVISKSLLSVRQKYEEINRESDGMPRVIQKSKNPFVLPLSSLNSDSYCRLEDKNEYFIEHVIKVTQNENKYTSHILEKTLSKTYKMYTERKTITDSLQSVLNQRMEISSEINRLFRVCKKEVPSLKNLKSLKTGEAKQEFDMLRDKLVTLNREINRREKEEGVGKDISYLRVQTKNKNSMHYSTFREEMKHFKNKKIQSTIEGVGLIGSVEEDWTTGSDVFNSLHDFFLLNAGVNQDKLYDDYVSEDSTLLFDLKKKSIEEYASSKTFFENTKLGHSCSFISRLAHSLMFYSQQSFSSDYVRVDNLGYKNVLLIVKGGKKIFKSKASKLFRIVYPYPKVISPWLNSVRGREGSHFSFEFLDSSYLITPWAFLHENTLTDSISFYQRVGSFVILNLSPEYPIKDQFHKVHLNVCLAFHNRRKTEVLLANLRYILLSTMGDFTGLHEILDEFFGFNYDSFQSYIRNSILLNYSEYFTSLQDLKEKSRDKEITESNLKNSVLKNIFTGHVIKKVEDLALMIYSTFLMTKAPYQKLVERANNLKGILEIHKYYDENVGLGKSPKEQFDKLTVTCENDYVEYSKKLFSNDFNFDPKYCALIGNFMDSYFRNNYDLDIFHSEWIKIQNSNWDEMATSTGLRGDYETVEDFWGKKGYFVVYKTLLKDDDFRSTLMSLFSSKLDENEKRKYLRTMNKLYKEKEIQNEFLIFHAVDKTQWRGNREIYVMDMNTKIMQQPIEKFMGFVCQKVDNELISVPSNKRAQMIHHSIFEKDLPLKEMLTWYLTLDCSKWAPKSIFCKFSVCLNNMSCIPNSFKHHLMNYFEKLYNKRLYFNVGEVEVLKNNPMYKEICDKYLVEDEKVKGYYLQANYTWVMGIFNYMSSFLHSANQKYFSYILTKSTIESYGEECTLVMYAHSDDSGGRLTARSPGHLQRALIMYEINLHSANHLISKKKSVVSRIYFEILSVIYLFKKLLALLPKFLGGLRFLPTDKGPCSDLLQAYSKCIEVIVAGADFSIAYIVLKMISYLVYRFYFNKMPSPVDYERPVQYAGMPDSHPIMALLCGTDSDILRLISMDGGEERLLRQVAYVNSTTDDNDGEGPIKPLKFQINIKNLNKDFGVYIEYFEECLNSWSVKNVNYHNTGLNTLNFLSKLKDPGFVGSLVNESQVRRISRSYHHRVSRTLVTRFGLVRMKPFIDGLKIFSQGFGKDEALKELLSYSIKDEEIQKIISETEFYVEKASINLDILKRTLKSPMKLNSYFNRLSLKNRNFINSNRTLKPALVQLNKGGQIFSVDFDPATLVSYLKEPEMKWALGNVKNLNTASFELLKYINDIGKDLETLSSDILLRLCRSFGKENVKNIYIYSRTPGDMRQIKTYTSFMTFLSVNSFSGKEIEGLTVNISDKDSSKEYVTMRISETSYFLNNVLSVMAMFIKKCKLEFIHKLKLNSVFDLEFQGGDCLDLMNHLEELISDSPEGAINYLHFNLLKNKLEGNIDRVPNFNKSAFYIFLKDQKSKSGWYGSGEVYISISGTFFSFKLKNNNAIEVSTNKYGKLEHLQEKFIFDVFDNIGISINKQKISSKSKRYIFGRDMVGGLGVLPIRETISGIPANIIETRGEITDSLDYLEIKEFNKDFVLVKEPGSFKTRKIYFLPLKKAELVHIIRMMFDPKDFEEKISSEGLNDFEDFIMTEILPEYGADLFVPFEQFVDNFTASRIYHLIKECKEKGYSKIIRDFSPSVIPAQEGSLSRILIDYSVETGENVVRTYKRIDSDIMRLRSEYPEKVSLILQEKLEENYLNLYTKKEIKEIENSYSKMINNSNIDEKRVELIKLMTFWGYQSLVNSIQNFQLLKSPENYSYFNYYNCYQKNQKLFSPLYPELLKILLETMSTHYNLIHDLQLPHPEMKEFYPIYKFNEIYVKNLCYDTFSGFFTMSHDSICEVYFINVLLGLFLEEEFTSDLQFNINKNFYLNSLPISNENKYEFICLLNTLKYTWMKTNSQKIKLDYLKLNERLKDDIVPPPSLMKTFGVSPSAGFLYYHGFLNTQLLNLINQDKRIKIGNYTYNLKNKMRMLSNQSVPLLDLIFAVRPLKKAAMEHESYEEVLAEVGMEDQCEESILEYWEEIEDKYCKKLTRTARKGKERIVFAEITWVICPYLTNSAQISNNIRQCGENLIILTYNYLPYLLEIKQVDFRLLKLDKDSEPILAYFLLQNDLKGENRQKFVDSIVGSRISQYDKNVKKSMYVNYMFDSDKVKKSAAWLGVKIDSEIMLNKKKMVKGEDSIEFINEDEDSNSGGSISIKKSKEDDNEDLSESELNLKKIEKMEENLSDITKKLDLSEEFVNIIKEPYVREMKKTITFDLIFKSMMAKLDLSSFNKKYLSGGLELTDKQNREATQCPLFFSGITSGNFNLRNLINDKKSKSEIDSIYPELLETIMSFNLKITERRLSVMESTYKMWLRSMKFSNYKTENKVFLLQLLAMIIRSSTLSKNSEDDHIWVEISDKYMIYLSKDLPEAEDEISVLFENLFISEPGARIKYTTRGI